MSQVYSKLEAREKELVMLRDGHLETIIKSKSSPEIKQEAFDNYLKTFFDRPKVEVRERTENLLKSLFKSILA